MPYPKTGSERARPDLADTLYEFNLVANMASMVGFEVLPIREVQLFTGTFGRVEAKQLLKRHANAASSPPGYEYQRAPRSAYAQDDATFTEDSWKTIEHGLEAPVDDFEKNAYRSYFEQEAFTTMRINNQLMTACEQRIAGIAFDTVTFAPGQNRGVVLSNAWDDYTSATPIDDVLTGMMAIYDNSGIWPDSMVMNKKTWLHLIRTDQIRERIHAQGSGDPDRAGRITKSQVAEILQIGNIIVAGGTKDGANPNAAFAPEQIWGPHCLLYKKAMTRDLREIGLGRTFHWALDGSLPNGYVEDYRDPEIRGTKIRVRQQLQEKLLYADVGYLMQTTYT